MFRVGRVLVPDEDAVGDDEPELGDQKNPRKLGQSGTLRHPDDFVFAETKFFRGFSVKF